MRKMIVSACFLAVFLNAIASAAGMDYAEPPAEGKTVIDTFALRPRPKDNVVIRCPAVGMTFEIFAHNPESMEWVSLGSIKGNGSLEIRKMSRFRYFAVRNEADCAYEFQTKNDDIVITVKYGAPLLIDGILMDASNSLVVDIGDNDAEDYFKFKNLSGKQNILIQAYLLKENSDSYQSLGRDGLTGWGSVVTMEADDEPDSYDILVLYFRDGCSFACYTEEKEDDLYVFLTDAADSPRIVQDGAAQDTVTAQLERLKILYDRRLIDESEYKQKKAQLLGL